MEITINGEILDVERLRLRPGDVVVFYAKERLSADSAAHCRDAWREFTKRAGLGDIPAITLDGGMKMSVLAAGGSPALAPPSMVGERRCEFGAPILARQDTAS